MTKRRALPFIRLHIGIPLGYLLPYAVGINLCTSGGLHAEESTLIRPKILGDAAIQAVEQPESFENYQIRILRNQNQIQTEKIKALREELTDLYQKMHELKPHLFAHADPNDQAKIATLGERL